MSDRQLPRGASRNAGFAITADRRLRLRRTVVILLVGDGMLRAWLRRGERIEALGRMRADPAAREGSDALSALLARLANPRRRRSVTLVLRLAANAGLICQDVLPGRAAGELQPILANRIDMLTPWSAEDAVFTCWNPQRRGDGRLAVTVAVARKAAVEAALASLRGFDLVPDIVDFVVDAPTSPPRFDLLRPPPESRVPAVLRGTAVAALGLLALAAVRGGFELADLEDRIAARQLRLEEMRRELAGRLEAVRQQGPAVSATGLLLELRRERTSPLRLLDAMTRLLPDQVWLESLQLRGRSVAIGGIAEDTAVLARLFERSPDFTDLRFTAPAVRVEPGGSETRPMVRFALTVEAGGALLLAPAAAPTTTPERAQ